MTWDREGKLSLELAVRVAKVRIQDHIDADSQFCAEYIQRELKVLQGRYGVGEVNKLITEFELTANYKIKKMEVVNA